MTPQALQKVSSTSWDWAELRSFCFGQALHVVGCRDTADDAAQEAIIRAWRHWDRRSHSDAVVAWVRTIAR